MSINVLKM